MKIQFPLTLCVAFAASLAILVSCQQTGSQEPFSYQNAVHYTNTHPGNPYLPLWEHTPDGEPRVFEDPDNPGKYRAYIITSHDVFARGYCGPDIRIWSAPVEDLTAWRDEGAAFTYEIGGQWDTMYAPDVAEIVGKDGKKTYYLYPNDQTGGRNGLVAVSDRPAGPYKAINTLPDDPSKLQPGSLIGFDPGVFVEYVTDENDPDYETGFRAYAFYGFQGSSAIQLDQNTMYTLRPDTEVSYPFIPARAAFMPRPPRPGQQARPTPPPMEYKHLFPGEDPKVFAFFEASSIRQVGNKYVVVYSGYSGEEYGLPMSNSTLRYAYADHPLGPYKSGGVIVDARSICLNEDGSALQTRYSGHNTHGSLLEINGLWYIFYHRAPRGNMNSRQAMVEPVKVEWDEASVADGGKVTITGFDPYAPDQKWTVKALNGMEYTGAEVTSQGFHFYGLDPYAYYSAGYACYLSNEASQQDCYDIWDNNMPITDVAPGDVIGYKYFGFGGLGKDQFGLKAFDGTVKGNNTVFNLWLTPKTEQSFKIQVWMDSPWALTGGKVIGTIDVPAGAKQKVTRYTANVADAVDGIGGRHAIFLIAEGSGNALCDIVGLGFSSDKKRIEMPVAPVISIFADNTPLEVPLLATRSNRDNGIIDMNIYEVECTVAADATKAPKIKAVSSDKKVKIKVAQAASLDDDAIVTCNNNGTIKYYVVKFAKAE